MRNGSSSDLPPGKVLHLWILNSNVRYASSRANSARTALKLLYRVITTQEAEKLLEPVTAAIEEITIPWQAIATTLHQLKATTLLLPDDQRSFQNWTVGLLDTWAQG